MLQNYLKIALRNLRAQRGYTLLNVLGLTVGIAGGLLIFLFLRYHLSTDRQHRRFERMYRIVTDMHLEDGSIEPYPEAPLPMAAELRQTLPQVEQAAFLMARRSMTINLKRPGLPTPLRFLEADGTTALVEPELFQILDYHWLQGNAETALRSPNSVVLTESIAQKYFGDTRVCGQSG